MSADPRLRRGQARDATQHRRQVFLLAGGESSDLITILGRAALSLDIRSAVYQLTELSDRGTKNAAVRIRSFVTTKI